ncbi:hypothetical protein GC177_08745 [bacterium]|nr:hypothetical protein [bacterium]
MYMTRNKKEALSAKATGNTVNLSEAAAHMKEDMYEVANAAGCKARLLLDDASTELEHAKDVVTAQIKEKPIQSSLIALGVGVVIGALLRR